MPIEGEDWIYLGGAALGGAILGAVGAKMLSPAHVPLEPRAPDMDLFRREYEVVGQDGKRGVIHGFVGVAFSSDEAFGMGPGYVVDFWGPKDLLEGGKDSLIVRFSGPEEAMVAADGFVAEEFDARPISEWQIIPEFEEWTRGAEAVIQKETDRYDRWRRDSLVKGSKDLQKLNGPRKKRK